MKFRLIIMVLLFGIFVAGAAAMVSELGVYPSQTFTASLPADDSNGSLYVTSYPTGATILINGTDYGTTNKFVNNVPVGIQNLTLIKAGYLAKTMMVNVPAGEVKILAPITLTKGEGPVPPSGTGSLYVASYPTNATILIDDTDRGMTDQLVSNVSAGDRTLTLTKVGYNATTMTVNVPANDAKILAPITLTKSGDGMQGGDGLSGGENGFSYTFDVLHGWNPIVAGQISIQNINTSTPTYSVTIQGIEPNKQHWLFYTTASGDKQFVTTDFTMKDGIWRHSGVWSNSIDDLMASPIFVLQDVPQSTSLTLVASKTDLEVSEQVTFTATLIQIDLRTGNQAPLNGQEVYILASDLSRNLCTPGPNGTYTWTTTITSLGNNTYNAAFFTTKYGEYIATRSNDVTIKFTKPTDIWLAVSNIHPKIWEQVTFTARLFQGNESIEKLLPLSDQSVYIINVADGSKNLCTPGPDGTYTWTWIPSPGRYAYHATFNGNDGYLASSSREVRFDFPTLTMHYEIHEEECQGSWLPVPDPRGLDCIYTVISLNGRLMDPDGTGIPGKTIQVYTNDLTQLVVTATTDANGNWEAPWIGVKQYNWPADTMTPWRSPPQAIAYFTGDNTYGEAWS